MAVAAAVDDVDENEDDDDENEDEVTAPPNRTDGDVGN
jgi:hypothetical protein